MAESGPFALLQKKDPDRYHYLLWLKFILANFLFSALFVLAVLEGWVDIIFAKNDKVDWLTAIFTFDPQTTYISAITAVFVFGWTISIQKVFAVSREINFVKQEHPPVSSRVAEYLSNIEDVDNMGRAFLFDLLWAKWFNRITIVGFLGNFLMLLGLVGTVIGFAMALEGVSEKTVSDVSAIGAMVAALTKGMGVALFTTIAGSFYGGMWLVINARIIEGGSTDLLTLLGERGGVVRTRAGTSLGMTMPHLVPQKEDKAHDEPAT